MIATEAVAKKKIWTEAELEALPEDGFNHEVVDGELGCESKGQFRAWRNLRSASDDIECFHDDILSLNYSKNGTGIRSGRAAQRFLFSSVPDCFRAVTRRG